MFEKLHFMKILWWLMKFKCITKVFISVVCVGDPAVASHLRHLCLNNDPVPAHKTLCKSVCGLTSPWFR